jgi:HPt (histidine-containing phosphotransfer) domain-containing protein
MAALNIAFEAPDNAGGMGPSNGRPIDLVHLARQTMGDKALELEVLQMFARRARVSMKELAGTEGAARAAVAHRLKGSARAVGADAIAAAAGRLEE